jgi:hypothetical protein
MDLARHHCPMATTPLWVPLLVAAMGLIATLLGTIMGTVLAAARAERREDVRWQRERERQQEMWSREDRQRTFDQKRDAYIDFHQRLRVAELAIHDMIYKQGPALSGGWQLPLYESLLRIRIFATPEVAKAAGDAYRATFDWGNAQPSDVTEIKGVFYSDSEEEQEVAVEAYLAAIRRDLGVELVT